METRFDKPAFGSVANACLEAMCSGASRLLLAGTLAAGSAHATLIGDTVGARLQDFAGGVVAPQFAPTAVVGGGVEFNGTWSFAPLNQVWNVGLDVDASSFTVSFNDVGASATHDIDGQTFLGLALSDLDIGGRITGVSVLSGGGGVQSIGFTDRGVTVQWNVFQFRDANGDPQAGGSWTFGIQSAIPEPTSWALVVLGLLAMAAVRQRHLFRVTGLRRPV